VKAGSRTCLSVTRLPSGRQLKDIENGKVNCDAAGSSGACLDMDNWVMADRLEQAQKTPALREVRGFLPGGSPVLNSDGGGSICHSSSVLT
jgi:hypothetical protein